MEIMLNGRPRTITPSTTVSRLLDELGLHPMRVAVQVGSVIIRKEQYDSMVLLPGAAVEIVSFSAGG
jgi:thiamine biosynthesis protein ThiS